MNSFLQVLKKITAPFNSSRDAAAPPARFRVVNLTRNTVIATSVEIATTSRQRSKGLLGKGSLAEGEGLWIVPCESVHTFGMRFAIDLVYLDKQMRIKKIRSTVVPWRISACLTAHSVLELPARSLEGTDARPGDSLEFSPAT